VSRSAGARIRHGAHRAARALLGALPRELRFRFYRGMVDCPTVLDDSFEFTIARSREDLEACFGLLHDAYVASGFMRAHPSGLRVTAYHALPTTTTLCAKVGGQVVGTLSIVRDGVFGFPLQSAFDISAVRAKGGRIAEISALAVHPSFRRTGGSVLFPLMKFMYEYCTRYFDTRHLVIAVHPTRIELYESLLFFRRLTARVVDKYDFANGAPAIGATLDLHEAPQLFARAYDGKPARRDLHGYFVDRQLPNIRFPARDWNVSNDPMLTPALADYFFNERTQGFAELDERRKRLLHSIYRGPEWARVLPALAEDPSPRSQLRLTPRFTFKCEGRLNAAAPADGGHPITIIELSRHGFRARTPAQLPVGTLVTAEAELGAGRRTQVHARVMNAGPGDDERSYGFHVGAPDEAWLNCVAWLEEKGD